MGSDALSIVVAASSRLIRESEDMVTCFGVGCKCGDGFGVIISGGGRVGMSTTRGRGSDGSLKAVLRTANGLPGEVDGADFAQEGHADFAGVGHFGLDALGDVACD